MKKILIVTLVFFVFVVISGAVLQNAGAQVDNVQERNCQGGYDSARTACKNVVFTCYDSCDKYDPGYYACMDLCTARNRDCIAAANNQYVACATGATTSKTTAPTPKSEAPKQESPSSEQSPAQPKGISVDDNSYAPALVQLQPTAEDLPDYEEAPGADEDEFYLIGTPYGPFVGKDLESRGIRVDYGIAFTQLKGGNPEIILPDGSKLDYTYRSFADLRQIPLGAKIVTPPGVEVKIKFSMSRLPESEKNPLFSPAVSPGSKIKRGDRRLSIQMGENSQITFDEMYRGFAKIVVNKGNVRFKHKLFLLQAASETGVMLGAKGTDFGMAYDPVTRQTTAEIYDGTIEIMDFSAERILTTLSAAYGDKITRAEIADDKTVIEKTAIPISEWPAFVAKQQKSRSNAWLWILVILVIGGISYLAYRKKDELMKIIKKEPKQSP